MGARSIVEGAMADVAPPPPPAEAMPGEEGGSERERLLAAWRAEPFLEADMISPEEEGGPEDGAGLVILTDPTAQDEEVARFKFPSAEEADDAVAWCLWRMNPGDPYFAYTGRDE